MTREEHVAYLTEVAVRTTPGEIPEDVMALLPGVFAGLLDDMRRWHLGEGEDDDLPFPLRMCACTDCIDGVAGDRVREITGREEYGFSQ